VNFRNLNFDVKRIFTLALMKTWT